jgi:hypothetical protein
LIAQIYAYREIPCQAQSTTSVATTVILSNYQNAVLAISNLRISSNYAIASNGCGATVAAYTSCDGM